MGTSNTRLNVMLNLCQWSNVERECFNWDGDGSLHPLNWFAPWFHDCLSLTWEEDPKFLFNVLRTTHAHYLLVKDMSLKKHTVIHRASVLHASTEHGKHSQSMKKKPSHGSVHCMYELDYETLQSQRNSWGRRRRNSVPIAPEDR